MEFTAKQIKELRLRLGWTQADMGRRMSCSSEIVAAWENGLSVPDIDCIRQMQYLQMTADNLSDQTAQRPLVDSFLLNQELDQISGEQWQEVLHKETADQ